MQTITANDVEFAYLEDGPADGPLALCLHGFPDTAHTWRHLLPELASAGYHAVAPFLRGYAPTSIPIDGAFQSGALAADASALHEALGGTSDAAIIGHDWGAFATYGTTAHQPDRWRKVVTMAVPPLAGTAGGFLQYDQIKRSFYIFFFQSPLADFVVGMNDLEFIARLWEDWSPGYDAREDIAYVRSALGDPANLAAALGYYRALLDPTKLLDSYADVQTATSAPTPQPTLYLHGAQDGCLGIELATPAASLLTAEGSRFEIIEGAGHFLHLERPHQVNRLILDFLAS